MKNIFKNKIFIIIISGCALLIVLVVFLLNLGGKKEDKLEKVKQSIENVFFYLPDYKYEDVNGIPDYCKVSLVYGTSYIEKYKIVSKEDTTKEVKKEDKTTTRAYSTEEIENALKKIIGSSATLNYDKDAEGDYVFTIENGCGYNNKNINVLSYDEENKYVTSLDKKNDNVSKVYTKWEEQEKDGNKIVYNVYALEATEKEDGSYDIYADKDHNYYVKNIKNSKNIEKEIESLFEEHSNIIKVKKIMMIICGKALN